jgi:hypothetical protein
MNTSSRGIAFTDRDANGGGEIVMLLNWMKFFFSYALFYVTMAPLILN